MVTEAELPESREILVIAHNQHRDADRRDRAAREGARAEAIAREHARLAVANLQLVLRHRGSLESLPGHSLITLLHDDASLASRG